MAPHPEDHEGPVVLQSLMVKSSTPYCQPRCMPWVYHLKLCDLGWRLDLSGPLSILTELAVSLLVHGYMGLMKPLTGSGLLAASFLNCPFVVLTQWLCVPGPPPNKLLPCPSDSVSPFKSERKHRDSTVFGRTLLSLTWERQLARGRKPGSLQRAPSRCQDRQLV